MYGTTEEEAIHFIFYTKHKHGSLYDTGSFFMPKIERKVNLNEEDH